MVCAFQNLFDFLKIFAAMAVAGFQFCLDFVQGKGEVVEVGFDDWLPVFFEKAFNGFASFLRLFLNQKYLP